MLKINFWMFFLSRTGVYMTLKDQLLRTSVIYLYRGTQSLVSLSLQGDTLASLVRHQSTCRHSEENSIDDQEVCMRDIKKTLIRKIKLKNQAQNVLAQKRSFIEPLERATSAASSPSIFKTAKTQEIHSQISLSLPCPVN